jgi:DNA-binding NarL/FixJ family response regulator
MSSPSEIKNADMSDNKNGSEIRVVIIDDHPGVRAGIRHILEGAADLEVVDEGGSGLEALRLVEVYEPAVLLLDMEMPGLNGVEVARRLKAMNISTAVLALSAYDDRQFILGMLGAGAAGYLLKEEALTTLIDAVRGVARGLQGWLSNRLASQMQVWPEDQSADALHLTPPELTVLRLLWRGESDQTIAAELKLDAVTLKNYRQMIFAKIKASSRDEAVAWVSRHRLFED